MQIHTANRGGGLDAGTWAGAELRLRTHSTKCTRTSRLLLLHRASAVLQDCNTSEKGRYLEALPFYFGRAQTETFGNNDAKTHVCVSFFLARSLLPSCVTVIQIESEMTRRRLDYSMSGFVYASGAVTMPDDHVTRCLCTYASHPTKFSR